MSNLAADVDSSEQLWTLTADIPSVEYLSVDSEVVQVIGHFPSSVYAPTGEITPPKIRVVRASGGTTAASHTGGTALTAVIPPSASGGATPDLAAVLAEGNDAGGAAADNLGRVTLTDDGEASLTEPGIIRRPSNPGNIGDGVPAAAGTVCVCDDGTVFLKLSSEDDADWDQMMVGTPATPTLALVLSVGASAADIPITAVGAPTDPTDAATKAYVDALDLVVVALSQGGGFVLPTADPGIAGRVWNDAGTLKVSAG